MANNGANFCRVCGFNLGYPPWGEDNASPDYAICDCCGVEFGYEDYGLASIRDYRNQWILSGAKWFDEKMKPIAWDIIHQMANIPPEYR